jgi:hypothetical protein
MGGLGMKRSFALSLLAAMLAVIPLANQAGASVADLTPPQPIDRQLFLRNDDSANCVHMYLSDENGPDDGNFCAYVIWAPPEVSTFEDNYVTDPDMGAVQLPITLDASKPLTGTIAVGMLHPNDVQLDVYVTLGTTRIGPIHVDTGLYTNSALLGAPPTFPISVAIPAALDKTDIDNVTVSIDWGQEVNAGGSVWLELDDPATSITIPAYDHSFTAGS